MCENLTLLLNTGFQSAKRRFEMNEKNFCMVRQYFKTWNSFFNSRVFLVRKFFLELDIKLEIFMTQKQIPVGKNLIQAKIEYTWKVY